MHRCVVFADSHGDTRYMEYVLERMGKVDGIIHLGDIHRDVLFLQKHYPEIPLEYVVGNNDFWVEGDHQKVIEVASHKIFITHGHLFRTTGDIAKRAVELGAEMALYGHTHIAREEHLEGIPVLNFGSISRPRKGNRSCGILEAENGKLSAMTYDYIDHESLF